MIWYCLAPDSKITTTGMHHRIPFTKLLICLFYLCTLLTTFAMWTPNKKYTNS